MKTLFAVFKYALAIALTSPALATEVKDSGILLANPTTKVIYWADEKHVVASIFEKEPWIAPDGTKKGVESIFIWNVETNELKRHAGPGAGGLCVGYGFIRYFQRRLSEGKYDELDRYYGPIGREQIQVLSGPIDRQTCRLESELSRPTWLVEAEKTSRRSELSSRTWLDEANKPPGRIFKPLKPEHGWLEFVGGDRGFFDQAWYPVAIHQPGKEDKGIPIDPDVFQPWLDQGYHVVFLRYEAFRDAYLLALDDTWSAVDGKTGKLWWLYPDGRIEEIVTYGHEKNWKNVRMNGLVPAKFNLLTTLSDTNRSSAKSGLYRQTTNGDLELLAKGWVGGGKSLSPDGCKMAYGIDPRGFWADGPKRYYLQVLDLCQSSK
jgi:hypothetical protein